MKTPLPARARGVSQAVLLRSLQAFLLGSCIEQEVFAFMTTEPNELTASINHERMPVLLTEAADFETWLSGSTEEAFKLAHSYAAEGMRIVRSGSERKDILAA